MSVTARARLFAPQRSTPVHPTRWVSALRPARWSVRARSAVAAGLVVALATVIGAAALLWILQRSLVGAVDAAASARATDVVNQLRQDSPAQLDAAMFTTDSRISVVQIVSPTGQVLRTSSPAWSVPLIGTKPRPGVRVSGVPAATGPVPDLRVTAQGARGLAGSMTVLVAASNESLESTLATVAVLLAIVGPITVLVAAGATYFLVKRSLGSVESIREHVAQIGSADLSGRVPVPAAHDEIARLAVTMNAMLARVQAGHAAQQQFVGDASHELRSPLATITTGLELARDRPEVLDHELVVGSLLPEAERMRHLVADLLTLAAADEQRLTLRITDVDLDDVAASAARAVRLHGSVAVRTRISPARIEGDPDRLARVVRNLLDNACTHAANAVEISTSANDGWAQVVVDDDGPGIPASDRSRVFDRFVRLESDRARTSGGSGLGLAIVAEIVAAHGGTVTADASPSGGARMTIALPVRRPERS